MSIHTTQATEQRNFLTNVLRARSFGVETKTCNAVESALLTGLTYCNFGHAVASLTDDYISDLQDTLINKAIELGKDELIKWVGFPG